MTSAVFYISGHGFGHASRNIEVINALRARCADLRVVVCTTAPKWLFDLTCVGAVEYHYCEVDTGAAQIGSLTLDVDQTVRQARAFMRTFDVRVADHAAFLQRQGASFVVADIPPLGAAAGATAGLPTIILGNFTWDWIYSAYPGTGDLVAAIAAAYARADLAMRLPMHGGFQSVSTIVDLPFVARRSTRDPSQTKALLGLPSDRRLALVSFGGYGLEGYDLDRLSHLDGYVALVTGRVPMGTVPAGLEGGRRGSLMPVDEHAMYGLGLRYEDLVRAVDVVVTKPGYGVIAECIANDTALLYTSRGDFIEYDALVAAMPRYLRARYLDQGDLFAGRWGTHLDAVLAQPSPSERPAVNGADVAADALMRIL